MTGQELLKVLSPCGLDCSRCLANPESPVSRLSAELKLELGGFSGLAPRFAAMDPVFAHYDRFEAVLDRFARAGCTGCRSGKCLLVGCVVKECVKQRSVDYCFQCPDFPCDRTAFPPLLRIRWLSNNERMRAVGPQTFYREISARPRY